jgi:hypothetical protein
MVEFKTRRRLIGGTEAEVVDAIEADEVVEKFEQQLINKQKDLNVSLAVVDSFKEKELKDADNLVKLSEEKNKKIKELEDKLAADERADDIQAEGMSQIAGLKEQLVAAAERFDMLKQGCGLMEAAQDERIASMEKQHIIDEGLLVHHEARIKELEATGSVGDWYTFYNDSEPGQSFMKLRDEASKKLADKDKKLAALTKFLGQDGMDIIEKNECMESLKITNKLLHESWKKSEIENKKLHEYITKIASHFKLVRNCDSYPDHCGHCGVTDCKLYHIKDKVCPKCGRTIVVEKNLVRCYYCSTGWTHQAAEANGLIQPKQKIIIPVGTIIKDIETGRKAIVTGYDKTSGPEWITYNYDEEKINYAGHIGNFKILVFPEVK